MQALIFRTAGWQNNLFGANPSTPAGCRRADVTVDIQWSSLNYKDALAITGSGKNHPQLSDDSWHRFLPYRPHSEDPRFHAGQQVLLTGWGVGENHWAAWPSRRA
nr:putative oxidoreductase [Raoultella sp. NCTC 9187]